MREYTLKRSHIIAIHVTLTQCNHTLKLILEKNHIFTEYFCGYNNMYTADNTNLKFYLFLVFY